jgi:hypothetical protein
MTISSTGLAEHSVAPRACIRFSQSTNAGWRPVFHRSPPTCTEGTMTMSVASTCPMPRWVATGMPLANGTGAFDSPTMSTRIGEETGTGPVKSQEMANRAGCAERYVREWLNSQAAGGYVTYHDTSASYGERAPAGECSRPARLHPQQPPLHPRGGIASDRGEGTPEYAGGAHPAPGMVWRFCRQPSTPPSHG